MIDFCAVSGFGLVCAGCWLVAPWVAMVVGGSILLFAGVAGHLTKTR